MSVELKIYERPELVTRVRPGHVLEALPDSVVTEAKTHGTPCRLPDPTGVFGYVRGHLEGKSLYYNQGTTLAELLIPCPVSFPVTNIGMWSSRRNEGLYLVVGELVHLDLAAGHDGYADLLEPDSVSLGEEQTRQVRRDLFAFSRDRAEKEYVFRTPAGEEYRLGEIILSLRERRN